MRMSFAWWNSALSPLGKPRANDPQKTIALTLIAKLLTEYEVDFMALGEVCSTDIGLYQEIFSDFFDIHAESLWDDDSKFSTCFLLRKQKASLIDFKNIILRSGRSQVRLAQQIDIIAADTTPMHIFISHWPSRLWCEQNSAERHSLGMRLRDSVDKVFDDYAEVGRLPYVVLLGDYNDEPFDPAMSEHLRATRDKALVIKKPDVLLYNPFWRHLVAPWNESKNDPLSTIGGSYFDKRGTRTRWRTFDQIIFSAAFLNPKGWRLNEKLTGIIDIPEYSALVTNSTQIFDHLPIIGVVEMEVGHG